MKFTDDLKDALIILKLGNYSWLLTDKMEYIFGIDYHPELIDEYIHDNFLVIEEHTFHKNLTLRLIKKINKQPREINKASQKNIYP